MINTLFSTCKTYPRLFLEEENASEIQEVMRKYEADQSPPGMVASVFLYFLKRLPCSLIDFEYCTTKSPPTLDTTSDLLSHMTPRCFEYLKSILQMIKLLSSKKVDNDLTKDDLITKFAPIICKPKSGAFMSVKHSLGIPTIKLYIKYLLDHYDELFEKPTKCHHNMNVSYLMNDIIDYHGNISPFYYVFISGKKSRISQVRDLLQYYHHLKKQIHEYEKIYLAEYGNKPEKMRDYSAIKDVYRQYNSLKKTLTNNAATEIQCLYRGYVARKQHPEMSEIAKTINIQYHLNNAKQKSGLQKYSGSCSSIGSINSNKKKFSYSIENCDVPFYNDEELKAMEMKEMELVKRSVNEEIDKYESVFYAHYHRAPGSVDRLPIRKLETYRDHLKQFIRYKKTFNYLTNQKKEISERLKKYEEEFEAKNGRSVSTREDLLGAKDDYKLYQKIKEKIQKLSTKPIL